MNYHIYYSRTTGKKVQLVVRATAVASLQEVVCYQELYDEYEFFVMSADEFRKQFTKKFPGLPEKDYPELERRGEIAEKTRRIEVKEECEKDSDLKTDKEQEEDNEQADEDLMRFLDAETYREKIEILEDMKSNNKLDEKMLNNIAVCLDLSLETDRDGYEFIMSELVMRKRYEKER
ncbi:MAG: hypothetical protein J6I65_03190 [Lachnospiraceae bacterium]|nr:hypothetical protein [Lachnospiraceae bacterium]